MSKPKKSELKFSAGFLCTMTRSELNQLQAACPQGKSLSQWVKETMLAAISPKPNQLNRAGSSHH